MLNGGEYLTNSGSLKLKNDIVFFKGLCIKFYLDKWKKIVGFSGFIKKTSVKERKIFKN